MLKTSIISNFLRSSKYDILSRKISTTPLSFLIQKWRQEKGLPMNPNASGILTDGPDYSFLDGRLTPLGSRQKQRVVRNRDTRDKIIELTKEIDFAVERHKRMKLDAENQKQAILDKKLKPKGVKLLNSKN